MVSGEPRAWALEQAREHAKAWWISGGGAWPVPPILERDFDGLATAFALALDAAVAERDTVIAAKDAALEAIEAATDEPWRRMEDPEHTSVLGDAIAEAHDHAVTALVLAPADVRLAEVGAREESGVSGEMVTREQIIDAVFDAQRNYRGMHGQNADVADAILALFEPLQTRVGELEKEATVAGGVFRDATVRWLDEKNTLRAQLADAERERDAANQALARTVARLSFTVGALSDLTNVSEGIARCHDEIDDEERAELLRVVQEARTELARTPEGVP